MKNLLFVISILFLFSCENTVKEDSTDYSKITLKMDTVMVDSGDEIINLKYGLGVNSISEDNKFLFLWSYDNNSLQIINLESLRLEKTTQFEKEGPNGIGEYLAWFRPLNENEVLLSGFGRLMVFDLEGKKIREHNLNNETFGGSTVKAGDDFERNPLLVENGDVVYGYLGDAINGDWTFVKADFREKKLTPIELPEISKLPDYRIIMDGEIKSSASPERILKKAGDRIILSNSAFSTIYLLDLKNDSIYQIGYNPKLSPKQKKGGYPEKVESVDRFREVMAEIDTEINFQAPVWDEQNRKFYRFSFETLPTDIYNGPLFLSPHQRPISKVYLSVFDENFNLLGETLLEGIKQVPNTVFVREGKIWSYVNVDDELGFVRMTINYE